MSAAHAIQFDVCENVLTALSETQTQAFEDNGFMTVPVISTDAEVKRIRRIVADLIAKRVGENEGALFDNLESKPQAGERRSIQITNPSNYRSELLDTEYVRNATVLAQTLLGPSCFLMHDFVLMKPAYTGAGTPWHQDEAYSDPKYDHQMLTFWMPLQDVNPEGGCMAYIPATHNLGLLEHRSFKNDPKSHAFECAVQFPESEVVYCPLSAGECVVHGQLTLHSSKDNVSSTDRYAYILGFGVPPTPAKIPRSTPWLDKRISPEQKARTAWLLRGGLFVLFLRKLKRRQLRSLGLIKLYFSRGIENVLKGVKG